MQQILLAFCLIGGFLGVANAETFDYELIGSYAETDLSAGSVNGPSSEDYKIEGAWFYADLSDKSGPRARAAFTDRASHIRFSFTDRDAEIGDQTQILEIGVKNVWRDSGWFVSGSAADISNEREFAIGGIDRFDIQRFAVSAGKYVTDNTTVELGIVHVDNSRTTSDQLLVFGLQHLGTINETVTYGLEVELKGGNDVNQTLAPSTLAQVDAELEWRVGGSLFVGKDLGLSLAYTDFSDPPGPDSISEWSAGASYFFTPSFSMSIQYRDLTVERESMSNPLSANSIEFEFFSIDLTARF